jgi:hypothetical protein
LGAFFGAFLEPILVELLRAYLGAILVAILVTILGTILGAILRAKNVLHQMYQIVSKRIKTHKKERMNTHKTSMKTIIWFSQPNF